MSESAIVSYTNPARIQDLVDYKNSLVEDKKDMKERIKDLEANAKKYEATKIAKNEQIKNYKLFETAAFRLIHMTHHQFKSIHLRLQKDGVVLPTSKIENIKTELLFHPKEVLELLDDPDFVKELTKPTTENKRQNTTTEPERNTRPRTENGVQAQAVDTEPERDTRPRTENEVQELA